VTYLTRHHDLDGAMRHVRRIAPNAGLAPGSRYSSWTFGGWRVRLIRSDLVWGTEHMLVKVEAAA